jgi:hypothetical protein
LLLHKVVDGLDRIINDGIIIYKLFLPGDWTFDLGLDFPYQVSSSGVHWIGPHRSLGFSVPLGCTADGPSLTSGTGMCPADSAPVNPVAVGEN